MVRRLALAAIAAALTLSAAALQAAEPISLSEAQAQLSQSLAKARQERAAQGRHAAPAVKARRVVELTCRPRDAGDPDVYELAWDSPARAKDLDKRCHLKTPLSETRTYVVSWPGFWGQNALQFPKGARLSAGRTIEGIMHTCEYDGEYQMEQDQPVVCTLTSR